MNRVTDLINQAIVATSATEKVECLYKVQELALNNGIIDNFLEEILAFQNDRSAAVRKFAVGFIEQACKKDGEVFPKCIINLTSLLSDENADVVKRAIQASTQLYKYLIQWTATKSSKYRQLINLELTENQSGKEEKNNENNGDEDDDDDVIEQTWRSWHNIKKMIFEFLESSQNDGVRTQCVKFIETVILLQTHRDKFTDDDHQFNIHDALPSLDTLGQSVNLKLPEIFRQTQKKMLSHEAEEFFHQLMIFHGCRHISSVNLMATMQTLGLLARQRCTNFMAKTINAFEALNSNLPPTLTTSQVNSVRKFLKLQLSILLKHPHAATTPKFNAQITQLLLDVGASQSEINKCLNDVRKRGFKVNEATASDLASRAHPSQIQAHTQASKIAPVEITQKCIDDAINLTSQELSVLLLQVENVADLVCHSLLHAQLVNFAQHVPRNLDLEPCHTVKGIERISRALAEQFTNVGIGKGVHECARRLHMEKVQTNNGSGQQVFAQDLSKIIDKIAQISRARIVSHDVNIDSTTTAHGDDSKVIGSELLQGGVKRVKLQQVGKPIAAVRSFQLNLEDVTQELDEKEKRFLVVESIRRILKDEKRGPIGHAQVQVKKDVLSRLAHEFHDTQCIQIMRDYVYDDFKNRHEIFAAIIKRLVEFGKDRALRRQHLVQSIPGNDPNDLYVYNPRLKERDARELSRLHVARDLAQQYYDSVKTGAASSSSSNSTQANVVVSAGPTAEQQSDMHTRITFVAETLRTLEELIATLEGRDPQPLEFPELDFEKEIKS